MTRLPSQDAATIDKIVAQLTASRPAYAAILRFYGPVFSAQAQAAGDTVPGPIDVDAASLHMRRQEGFALIEPASFPIDLRAAEKLLAKICDLSAVTGEKLGAAGNVLALAMAEGLAMEALFVDVLADKGRIQTLADEKGVAVQMLALLLYLAIRPSITAGACQLADHLNGDVQHRSSCPICGSAPILGELDDAGSQWMHCGLCWYRWPVERMVCLFCGNHSRKSLEYLYSEAEPEYRLYLCGDCHQYLKVVDTRQLKRGFLPPLEQVVSLHLDMVAAEKGYAHPMGSALALT